MENRETGRDRVFAGIDAGSRTVKVVLVDEKGRVLASGIDEQGVDQTSRSFVLLERTAGRIGLEPGAIRSSVATGYGRGGMDFAATTVTEITCHARGVAHQHPEVRTIIDIGGQDSKLIRLQAGGRVRDFMMNDRCAAGTGRFLEVVAEKLELGILDLGRHAEKAEKPSVISSMCVVFAETEILGLLASGERRENIVAGVQTSIASRIASMAGRRVEEPVYFTGGVALVSGMLVALQKSLGRPVAIADDPQMTGALGAALLAASARPGQEDLFP